MSLFRRLRIVSSKGWTRFSAGVAMLSSLTWLLWPKDAWQLEPEPLAVFIATVLSWLAVTFLHDDQTQSPVQSAPHPHDIALFERFEGTVTQQQRAFLRHHSFASPYRADNVRGLIRIVDDWYGADFEFSDPEVQGAFQAFHQAAQTLVGLFVEHTYTTDNNVEIMSPLTDMDRGGRVSQETLTAIRRMDAALAELLRCLDGFLRTARDKLRRAG